MAGERDLQSLAERCAVQSCDHRLVRVLDSVADLVDFGPFEGGVELRNIGAGGESLARSGENDGMGALVGFSLPDGGQKPVANFPRQRIEGRIIDSYNANAVLVLVIYGIRGHECSPTGRYLLFKFGLDEQYSSLKGTVNGLRRATAVDYGAPICERAPQCPCSERGSRTRNPPESSTPP